MQKDIEDLVGMLVVRGVCTYQEALENTLRLNNFLLEMKERAIARDRVSFVSDLIVAVGGLFSEKADVEGYVDKLVKFAEGKLDGRS